MNDQTRDLAELAQAAGAITPASDVAAGDSHRRVPSIRPAALPPSPATAISPLTLLRALKRRLALALGLGVLAVAIAGPASWFFLPAAKFRAQARLQVSSRQPQIVFEMDRQGADDYKRYQKTQLGLLRSRFVFNAALQKVDVAKSPMFKDIEDPVTWLLDNIEAQFKDESELMEIALSGDNPQELAKIVNAVTNAYIDEVVDKERKQRLLKQETLKRVHKTYTDMTKSRRDTIRNLAEDAGSDDRQTLVLKQQYAMDYLAAIRKEHMDVLSQKRKIEASLKTRRPEALQETAAVSSSEIEHLVDEDPAVSDLAAKLYEKEQQLELESSRSKKVARKTGMDPVVKHLRDEVDTLRKSVEKKRKIVRAEVRRQLENPQQFGLPNKDDDLKQDLARLEEIEKTLTAEMAKHKVDDQKLTTKTLDLQDYQDDLKQAQLAADKIGASLEELNVELQAPSRVILSEKADPPTKRDEKKRYMMIGAITLSSFFGIVFGIAFLEVQTRKVDTADDVLCDLGLSVVGALPLLPSRSRNTGTLARTEKDRYWYNLLLESIDATRTMLIHAARSGNFRVVMITSALPGEGKTSLASHLSTSLARSGLKTLLLDADLRNPSIHRLFELTPEPGISELLRGEASLEDVIATTGVAELNVITAGKCDYLTLRVLSQGGMGGVFAKLKDQYDFVIVDTSPILPVTDALLIAQQCDAVLFSILRDVSRKAKISAAYQRLATLGIRILGAVVTGGHEGDYGKSYYPSDALTRPSPSTKASSDMEPKLEPEVSL
jgi:succinoglycan biosynthesis transport protein ExoP